uniref:Arachidonate lipoxygenase 3 n=1 Tax=Chelonoidis abingdonii TaxID=106734 RepID=A0A8C0GVC3_CHEAB
EERAMVGPGGAQDPGSILEPRLCARSSNPTPVLCLSQVREYKVPSKRALGPILLIRLHKEPYSFFPENMWYCNTVRVTSPEGNTYCFPCYRWIQGYRTVELAESTAKSLFMQADASGGRGAENWRSRRWICPVCGIGYWVLAPTSSAVGEVGQRAGPVARETDKWVCVSPEYVTKHWQEDAFFGYQYLNGFNPVLIRKCTALPENFPVTQEMVAGSLGESTSLQEELQRGSIYIADYKLLEDIPTTKVNGHQQYIAAPLCLLHQKPSGEVVPLAIQLSQHPGPDSPIFLPSDSEWLWTLAKTWVRNSEFHLHEVTSHLLRAHLLAEVFAVATQRQLPMCHPLYKAIATGRRGLAVLLRKALENLTYRTLCLPDDIQERGVRWGSECGGGQGQSPLGIQVLYGRKPCIRGLFCWDPANILSHTKLGLLIPEIRFQSSLVTTHMDALNSFSWKPLRHEPNRRTFSDFDASAFTTLPIPFQRPLGTYPDEHFTEHGPKQLMAAFQDRLAEISQEIEERNRSLSLSYNYMYPPNIENSTAI